MSVAFAKQTELSRITRQKEAAAQKQIVHQQGMHFGIKKHCSEEEVDSPVRKSTEKGSKHEELKLLCKEQHEESSEINSLGEQLHSSRKPDCVLGQTTHESVISEELFSHVKGLTAEETPVSVKKNGQCVTPYLSNLPNGFGAHFDEKTAKKEMRMKIPFKYFPFKWATALDLHGLPFFPVFCLSEHHAMLRKGT